MQRIFHEKNDTHILITLLLNITKHTIDNEQGKKKFSLKQWVVYCSLTGFSIFYTEIKEIPLTSIPLK